MQKIEISKDILNDEKTIIEDLIVAAHNNAKAKLKNKTNEEISKATGGLGIQDLNSHFRPLQKLNEIDDLIKIISKLPGLGPKSAKRSF